MLFRSLSIPTLLAVLATSASLVTSQLALTPPGKAPIAEDKASTQIKLKLAQAPKGEVNVYWEAPNFQFGPCKAKFDNKNTEVTIDATPLPLFSGDFKPEVTMNFMALATDPADKAVFEKNSTYTLVRSVAKSRSCKVFSDPHWYTFDGKQFDIMTGDCMTMVTTTNLVVQVFTIPHSDKITVVRKLAFHYNGAVVFFAADEACGAANMDKLKAAGITVKISGNPNTMGYQGQFELSDGTCITAQNDMQAADGRYVMWVQVTVPAHLNGKTQGICGNNDGNPANDNLAPDTKTAYADKAATIWLPIQNDLGNAWKCTGELNLFKCGETCTGIPKGPKDADTRLCQIGKNVASDIETMKPIAGYATAPPPTPPAPLRDPEIEKKAREGCSEAFKVDAKCKDAFVAQDNFLKQCITDCIEMQSLNPINAIRSKYMDDLSKFTKPIGQDPKHPLHRKVIECRVELGLGSENVCLNNCSNNGECRNTGCVCKAGFTGDDCSAALPAATPADAKAEAAKAPAPAPAPVPAPAPAAAAGGYTECTDDQGDWANYDPATKPVLHRCIAYTGEAGIFDDEGAQTTKLDVKVCADRNPTKAKKQMFCINTGKPEGGAHVTCTGDDTKDNIFTRSCTSGYGKKDAGHCALRPGRPTGMCRDAVVPVPDRAKFEKLPCCYFDDVIAKMDGSVNGKIPAGESRYFCIGNKGDHLLQCPQNKISKCEGGCKTKFEQDGTTPCGKAACAKGVVKVQNTGYEV